MRKFYFVDAENVGCSWINLDIEFQEFDEIHIFKNEKIANVPKKFIEDCAANINTVIIKTTGHNNLDILIGGIIGTFIGAEREFFIISNDTGYKAFIDYFFENYNCKIEIINVPEIFTSVGKVKNKIKKLNISKTEKEDILVLIDKYRYDNNIKNQIYQRLYKKYGFTKGSKLYNKIKKQIKI